VLALLLLLLVAIAAPAFAADVTLTPGESRRMEIFGVTAAWTIDASVADVSVVQGSITLFGRAAGRTKLIVSGVTGEHTYDVSVTQRAGTQTGASHARADRATAELRYASAAGEVQSAVHVTHEDAKRRTEATLRTIHQTETPAGERARTSVAEASYRIFTPGRELTFFDRDVDHSPLTLAATPLRGIHYLDEHWRLHAGYTAYATYRSFLVPIERQFVAGGGYAFRASARSTVTPSFFAIRGEGTVGSVLYDYARDERLAVRGEIGYSHGLGAAGAVDYDGERDRVYASLRYRPHDFAVAGNATPRGFFGDASWTHEYGRGSTGTASWSATDTAGVRVMSAAADVDHRLNDDLALLGGASWASFDGRRTWTIPAGVRAELGRVGVTALYRQSSGGPGGRLALRTSLGRFYASAYADHQRNVPTLAVLFAERPDLALALEELGINASSPADVARALREHAVLAELGFIDGVTLELAPSRTQFGFEAAYLGTTAARQQLRLRLLRNVIETVSARTTSTIATISYARRLTDAADVFASWTYWRTDTAAAGSRTQPFAEIGVRRSFDTLPSLFGGSGTIAGAVFADEDLDGRSDGRGVAAEVELDGAKVQRTREDGSFAFTGVPGGVHRVTARVPDRPEAYFTTPSRVEAEPGQRVEFGVSATPARLLGRVIDDAGRGIAGVRVLLARGAKQLVATTSSDGGFSFAASPGEWQMSLLTDSVPAGYSVTGSEARAVMLDLAAPAQVRVALDAHRGIRGQAAPAAEIDVQPLRIRVRADAQGRYALRSLPPGALTLTSGGIVRRVELPAEPATLTVDFAAAVASAPPATAPVVRLSGQFVVQLGAFRNSANAAAIAARARAAGVEVTLQAGRSLTFVRTTPLPTRASVEALVARLARAGLEAVVLFEN
jgi:hypothetical protein